MIKKSGIFLAALLAVLIAMPAFAHPAREVSMSWNNGSLTVKVQHGVDDPAKHFIQQISVYVNDKMVAQKKYTKQATNEGMSDTFQLGALAPKSVIRAEVTCVIMGTTNGTLTVQ